MFKNVKDIFFKDSTLSAARRNQLLDFERAISVHFNDLQLLDLAFHHRSYSNEGANTRYNNERLEFLGDAVLGMATATYLYESMLERPEGDLARIKSVVVSEMTLAPIALEIGVDSCLVLGKGEELSGGRTKKAILADAVEAVIGAYYLDSGYSAAEKLVLELIVPEIQKVLQNKHHRDYKTLLQEFYQKKYKECPVYELVKRTGPDHDRTFWVSVHLHSVTYGPASGKNKKEAEQSAARLAWEAVEGGDC
nr:ribonuclease III [Treponema brennaborense]